MKRSSLIYGFSIVCSLMLFGILWANSEPDLQMRDGLALVTHQEALEVQGGICLPIIYVPLKIAQVGIGGCGGPTKDAQAACNLTPLVCGPCIAPRREWEFKTCMECGESCGSYQRIDPTSCSAD